MRLRLVSFDRRKIRIRFVLQLIVIEIALAFFFLHAESGLFLIKYISGFFESLLKFAAKGPISSLAEWVKKGWRSFSSACFARLFYLRTHWYSSALAHSADFIRLIGTLLSKLNGMGKLESFNAVSSLILGQSENFIAYKGVLGDLVTSSVHHGGHGHVDRLPVDCRCLYDHARR